MTQLVTFFFSFISMPNIRYKRQHPKRKQLTWNWQVWTFELTRNKTGYQSKESDLKTSSIQYHHPGICAFTIIKVFKR